jgi:hypothetical protein
MDTVTEGVCPVCGYNLGFPAWKGKSASDEICPCCYIQFGYDDWADGDAEARGSIYAAWRKRWIDEGMNWRSKGRPRPAHWDPLKQLQAVLVEPES